MNTSAWIPISSKYMEELERKNIGGTVFKMFKSPHDVPRHIRTGAENKKIFLEMKYLDEEDVEIERFENYFAEIGKKSGRIFKVVVLNSEVCAATIDLKRKQEMFNAFDRALENLKSIYRKDSHRKWSYEVLENARLIEKIISTDIKKQAVSI